MFVPNLVRGSSKADPAVVEGDDKLALMQLHVDLASSEQHQRVDGDHAAVPDEHPARFHLLVVDEVGAGVVARLLTQREGWGAEAEGGRETGRGGQRGADRKKERERERK